MAKIKLSSIVLAVTITIMLTGCNNQSYDYELRLIENENKFTINSQTTSNIIETSNNGSSLVIYTNEENTLDEDIIDIWDKIDESIDNSTTNYDEDLDNSIIIDEEDVIIAEIETDIEDETEDETVDETEDEIETEIEDEIETETEIEAETTEETTPTTIPVVTDANGKYECIHLDSEHIFSTTLINYIGVGNYAKWLENDTSNCNNGLSIYDYMDNFNMTKGFFNNLTANDSTYDDVDIYAYGDFIH